MVSGIMPLPVAPRSTVEEIVQHLRSMIHRGQLGPGDRLPSERDLAEQLGVGRLTLREALAVLQHEGYLQTKRGAKGGTFVTPLREPFERWLDRVRDDFGDLEDCLEYRAAVERRAVRLATRRRTREDLDSLRRAVALIKEGEDRTRFRQADDEFHRAVVHASRSPRLTRAVDEARGELFAVVDVLEFELDIQTSHDHHEAIYLAIRDRDVEAAVNAVETHITYGRQAIRRILGID